MYSRLLVLKKKIHTRISYLQSIFSYFTDTRQTNYKRLHKQEYGIFFKGTKISIYISYRTCEIDVNTCRVLKNVPHVHIKREIIRVF